MCMYEVTWTAKTQNNLKATTKWQKGYKVFNVYTPGSWDNSDIVPKIKFPHYSLATTDSLELNKIYKAISTRDKSVYNEKINKWEQKKNVPVMIPCGYNGKEYRAGFHIFPVKMAAKIYLPSYHNEKDLKQLFEVEYRKVCAEGTHSVNTTYPVDCVIAQEMRIIRQLTPTEYNELHQNHQKIQKVYNKHTKNGRVK